MSDFSALIQSALSHTLAVKGADYFARPAGSTLVGANSMNGDTVVALLGTLDWTDVTEEASACGGAWASARTSARACLRACRVWRASCFWAN